jgi:hypothetical protein
MLGTPLGVRPLLGSRGGVALTLSAWFPLPGTFQHSEFDLLPQPLRLPGDVQVESSAVGPESEQTAQWTAFDLNLQELVSPFDMNMPDGLDDVPSMPDVPTDGFSDVSGLDYGLDA